LKSGGVEESPCRCVGQKGQTATCHPHGTAALGPFFWHIFFQLELRYYKSAVAAEATENGVTILTGASVLKLYHKIRTKFGSWQVTTLSRLQWIPKKMFLLPSRKKKQLFLGQAFWHTVSDSSPKKGDSPENM